MTPKDIGQWSAIALALGTACAAHFGVAQRARDAALDGEHTRQLLLAHITDAKEVHQRSQAEASQLRIEAALTRERQAVGEEKFRQLLDGQAETKAAVHSLQATVQESIRKQEVRP